MKKLFLYASVALMLTACGGNKPANTDDNAQDQENIDGKTDDVAVAVAMNVEDILLPKALKGKVVIVKAEKSIGEFDYPEVNVTFELLETVNTKPLSSAAGQMWIVGVGQDADGAAVASLLPYYGEWRTNDSAGEVFKDFLSDDPGRTITMTFTGDKGKEKGIVVKDELEKVKKLDLRLTK